MDGQVGVLNLESSIDPLSNRQLQLSFGRREARARSPQRRELAVLLKAEPLPWLPLSVVVADSKTLLTLFRSLVDRAALA